MPMSPSPLSAGFVGASRSDFEVQTPWLTPSTSSSSSTVAGRALEFNQKGVETAMAGRSGCSQVERGKSGECNSSTEPSLEEQIERSKSQGSLQAEFHSSEEERLRPRRNWQKFVFCCSNNTKSKIKSKSSVEEQIEKSKSHWSTPADQSVSMDDGEADCEAEVSNVQEFVALQRHPTWGGFFRTFYGEAENIYDDGSLEVGQKFAEGGQAELFHAHVTWWYPEENERLMRSGVEYVLKVFKKGTFLKHLKSQLPLGLLQNHAWEMENLKTLNLFPRFQCKVHRGTLLEDGRFAFLMEKEDCDLRNLIERNMRSGENGGPFSKEEVELMMYDVALGVEWLHNRNIVHRDLKASNVLVQESKSNWQKWFCYVADYECSVGVVGTGFFRAPEILQACKDEVVHEMPEVFSKAADVYSYGMTYYEILTGKLPFDDHPFIDNKCLLTDLVINQHLRPKIPKHVAEWVCKLLSRCWQSNLVSRPLIGEILDVLSTNSAVVRRCEVYRKKKYGENYKVWQHTDISNMDVGL